jgi:hypothetical protein
MCELDQALAVCPPQLETRNSNDIDNPRETVKASKAYISKRLTYLIHREYGSSSYHTKMFIRELERWWMDHIHLKQNGGLVINQFSKTILSGGLDRILKSVLGLLSESNFEPIENLALARVYKKYSHMINDSAVLRLENILVSILGKDLFGAVNETFRLTILKHLALRIINYFHKSSKPVSHQSVLELFMKIRNMPSTFTIDRDLLTVDDSSYSSIVLHIKQLIIFIIESHIDSCFGYPSTEYVILIFKRIESSIFDSYQLLGYSISDIIRYVLVDAHKNMMNHYSVGMISEEMAKMHKMHLKYVMKRSVVPWVRALDSALEEVILQRIQHTTELFINQKAEVPQLGHIQGKQNGMSYANFIARIARQMRSKIYISGSSIPERPIGALSSSIN